MDDMNTIAKDLKPLAIKKAVLSTAVQKPITVYSGATAVLAGAYGLAFSFSPLVIGLAGVGLLASILSGGIEYLVRGDLHANNFVKRYRRELENRRTKSLKDLTAKLSKIRDDRGLKQLQLFKCKYDNFVNILDQKLAPGELTYNRYLTIAEQVFLAGLDNLESSAIAQSSVSAIDCDHLENEIKRIDNLKERDSFLEKQRDQLIQRLKLREQQLQKVEEFLLDNEHALTQLDHVATRIANINTQQGRAQVDLEEAMEELKYLIERADHYSN